MFQAQVAVSLHARCCDGFLEYLIEGHGVTVKVVQPADASPLQLGGKPVTPVAQTPLNEAPHVRLISESRKGNATVPLLHEDDGAPVQVVPVHAENEKVRKKLVKILVHTRPALYAMSVPIGVPGTTLQTEFQDGRIPGV